MEDVDILYNLSPNKQLPREISQRNESRNWLVLHYWSHSSPSDQDTKYIQYIETNKISFQNLRNNSSTSYFLYPHDEKKFRWKSTFPD